MTEPAGDGARVQLLLDVAALAGSHGVRSAVLGGVVADAAGRNPGGAGRGGERVAAVADRPGIGGQVERSGVVHGFAAVTRGARHLAPVALLQVTTRGRARRRAHSARVVARVDVRVALGAADLARVLRPPSTVTASCNPPPRVGRGRWGACDSRSTGRDRRSSVLWHLRQTVAVRPRRVALVLSARVTIGAGEPRSVLGFLTVTGDAVLESGGGGRAVVEGRGVRVAVEAGRAAAGMLLLPGVAGGAAARTDGCVGEGVVVDVVVHLAVERRPAE